MSYQFYLENEKRTLFYNPLTNQIPLRFLVFDDGIGKFVVESLDISVLMTKNGVGFGLSQSNTYQYQPATYNSNTGYYELGYVCSSESEGGGSSSQPKIRDFTTDFLETDTATTWGLEFKIGSDSIPFLGDFGVTLCGLESTDETDDDNSIGIHSPSSVGYTNRFEETDGALVLKQNVALGNSILPQSNHHEYKYGIRFFQNKETGSGFESLIQRTIGGVESDSQQLTLNLEEINQEQENLHRKRFAFCGKYVVDFVRSGSEEGNYTWNALLYEGRNSSRDCAGYAYFSDLIDDSSYSNYKFKSFLSEDEESTNFGAWKVQFWNSTDSEWSSVEESSVVLKVVDYPTISDGEIASHYSFDSDGSLDTSYCCERNSFISKGRLVSQVPASVDSSGALTANFLGYFIASIPDQTIAETMNLIEFSVEDKRAFNPFDYSESVQKTRMFVFDSATYNTTLTPEAVLNDFFQPTGTEKCYLNGDYWVSITAFDKYGNVATPTLVEFEMAYFPGALSLKLSKESQEKQGTIARYYVGGLAKSAIIPFSIKHKINVVSGYLTEGHFYYSNEQDAQEIEPKFYVLYKDNNGNNTYRWNGSSFVKNSGIEEIVDDAPFVIKKAALASTEGGFADKNDTGDYVESPEDKNTLVNNEISEFQDVGSLSSDSEFGSFEYNPKNMESPYKMAIPFGESSSAKENISIAGNVTADGVSLLGTYFLMTYQEANEEGNFGYSEDTYTGYKRIYKKTANGQNPLYIRAYEVSSAGWLWGIFSNTIAGTNNGLLIRSTRWDVEDPAEALKTYSVSGGSTGTIDDIEHVYPTEGNGRSKNLSILLQDEFGNEISPKSFSLEVLTSGPQNISLMLYGSNGSTKYTGFYEENGKFFPSDFVIAMISASSEGNENTGLQWKLKENGTVIGGNEWHPLENGKVLKMRCHLSKMTDKTANLLGVSRSVTVELVMKNEAGNTASVSKSILYTTKLYQTLHQHLLEESPTYSHLVSETDGQIDSKIDQRKYSTTDYVRSWHEVWYPEIHGMPIDESTGEIDAEQAKRISMIEIDESGKNGPTSAELAMYDRLSLKEVDGELELETDDEGRYLQNTSRWNALKTYGGMENSVLVDGEGGVNSFNNFYKIIDNSGNVEFKLEFEIFDFSTTVNRLAGNRQSPEDGDMLAFYDASDDGCCQALTDKYGHTYYELKDTSKLNLLFVVKGSCYDNVSDVKFKMVGSKITGDLEITSMGFVTPSLAEYKRICLVPFTDYGDTGDSVGSGFKLKAGPKHYVEYANYEFINDTGQFWIHTFDGIDKWTSPSNAKITYKYYGEQSVIDVEKGTVAFSKRLQNPLVGTFATYAYLNSDTTSTKDTPPYRNFNSSQMIRSFMSTQDDYVDYLDSMVYVVPNGTIPNKNARYGFESGDSNEGRITNNISLTKEIGKLEFNNSNFDVPVGRIMGDYRYHTFYRLTSDGYGDLYFYGNGILVPAAEEPGSHTDWTYVDLKIVNEGTNTLNNGTLQFLARGYVTAGTIVDTVLDQNRPWDVQEGTTAETVQRTGAICAGSYSEINQEGNATRKAAFQARSKQTCVFGKLESKQTKYIRVYWCIANDESGTQWIDCTRGRKTFSAELSGMYFISTS